MGPTATGKTELAAALVARLPLEIISVDSAMVYRGMDIGSSKPSADLLAAAPHRLIDFLDPREPYSAARFREDALREMAAIRAAGNVPLLVGGTMLYFRALEQGLSPLPSADARVRAEIADMAASEGWSGVHRRLQAVDPRAAARIHPNDPQRLQRALEVYRLTGRPMSELQAEGRRSLDYRPLKLGLWPRDWVGLRDAIARRFSRMLDQGLISEVKALYEREDLGAELPAVRAVGYRQVWAYLAGEYDYETMVEQAVIATRQLAKRQLTWLRSDPAVERIGAEDADADELARRIERHLASAWA